MQIQQISKIVDIFYCNLLNAWKLNIELYIFFSYCQKLHDVEAKPANLPTLFLNQIICVGGLGKGVGAFAGLSGGPISRNIANSNSQIVQIGN